MDLAKTGMGYAFQNVNSGLRLGWTTINNITSTALGSSSTNSAGVNALNQTTKTAFYTWLYSEGPSGSTPLREALIAAGKYFSRADDKGPWADAPDATSKGLSTLAISGTDTQAKRLAHASCRRSYTMLLTDGYYNDDDPTFADTDYTAISQISGETPSGTALTFNYDGRTKPYAAQSTLTTIADIAMKYWVTDLRPAGSGSSDYGLKNNVPKSNSNPSFWQNMGFYAVGLGIDGTLTQDVATLGTLTSGPLIWPEPDSGGDGAETIDDLWHAAINGRGRMLSARNADALADGVEGMLAEINTVIASQSGVAASTLSLSTLTKKYTPNYTTGTWFGNVISSSLEAKSGAELCTQWRVVGSWLTDPTDSTKQHWYVNGRYDGTRDLAPCVGSPSTYSGIPDYTSRNVFAWNGTAFSTFDDGNSYVMSATTGVASGKSTAGDTKLVNYLRGQRTYEDITDTNGAITTTNLYRARQYVLGDIVNSTPTFIKGALLMGYDQLPAGTYGQSTYNTFVAAKAARAEGVLFAGANDGMLHGFRESTGAEVFAFVPRAAMPNMHQLASRSYDHLYFVDGPTVEADACLSSGSACTVWSNLVLGTGGAGSKTVFALDVTLPMTMNASNVKWEITSAGSFANMGHILTDVQTGLTMSGDWVAVFGNGYNGGTGTNASLFIVNLDTGALIKEIVVPSTIPVTGGNNGLGGVRLLRDDNKRIIAAYAGDLKGNLWKFDLSSASSGVWAVGLSNTPLYKTADTTSPAKQPIMATPTVVKHPLNGYVVAFGTGKLFESADVTNTVTQTLYGVWDSVTPPAVTQIDKTSLIQQTITTALAGSNVITNSDLSTSTVALNYYGVSRNPVNWTTVSTTPRGWYIDLPNTGQRVIYPLEVLIGTYAAADTVSPYNVSVNPCLSSGSGRAWNYVIDLVTGNGTPTAIFANNGGISGTIVSGYESLADGRSKYIKNDANSTSTNTGITNLTAGGGAGESRSSGDGGGAPSMGFDNCTYDPVSCPKNNSSSSNISRRTWRQLFLR
jgi:type IV pilus assembly protein PilY1